VWQTSPVREDWSQMGKRSKAEEWLTVHLHRPPVPVAAFTSASGSGRQIFWTALSERRGELEFGWRAKPETDTFGHEPALVARTPTPAKLLGFVKFVGIVGVMTLGAIINLLGTIRL